MKQPNNLISETKSTLDVNITEQLMQQIFQLSARWTFLKSSFERDDIRNSSIRSRSDHLPYLLKNETGSDITFTTAVEDIQMARNEQRKTSVRWIMVAKDCDYTFEFPARLLFYSLIVRVTGWDEISPVNVDACGTYFRIVKAVKQGMPNARLVVRVTMEKDGKKVVVVRSSIDIHNELPHRLAVFADNSNKVEYEILETIFTVSFLRTEYFDLSCYRTNNCRTVGLLSVFKCIGSTDYLRIYCPLMLICVVISYPEYLCYPYAIYINGFYLNTVEHKLSKYLTIIYILEYYNIGVEVRAGTGRYKDTQMVLLTSRYVLNNQSSYMLSVCHHDMIERVSEHVHIAPQCSLVWNENYEDCRRMCVRRSDVRHWSCPFRIDRIGSFHVTMRHALVIEYLIPSILEKINNLDADETPRFVRVEIILSSAVFCITFTDAEYYPPQIQIDNQSDVPVLYQQQSEGITSQHLRTICKARSHVDYAWDDLYGNRRIVLQVYENKSHVYDPSFPGIGPQLVYENHVYIQLAASFNNVLYKFLVIYLSCFITVFYNIMFNYLFYSCGNQLWSLGRDGCIENIGMKNRSRVRMVLDVLERTGYQLMMTERNSARDHYQKWTFMPDGRLCCQSFPNLMVTARRTDVCLAERDNNGEKNEDGMTVNQVWKMQRQRPGSGTLDVECQHSGPTLVRSQFLVYVVVRITDREQKMRAMSAPVLTKPNEIAGVDISVTMRAGIGISLINGFHEELLYARLGGIVINARKMAGTYQLSASVDDIQIDNQLLLSDRWQILFCKPENPGGDEDGPVASDLPPGVSATVRPALKLEMNCSPMNHYDAFELSYNFLLIISLFFLLFILLVLERPDPLRTRRWYFGTLDLEMGQIALSGCYALKYFLKHHFIITIFYLFYVFIYDQITYFKYFVYSFNSSVLGGIVSGTIKGISKGAVDTLTKPVQGLFDLVEGTASAMKQLAGPSTGVARRSAASGRVRPPRLCRNLYHLLPPFNIHLANAQIEMLRINGYSTKERIKLFI
uniref:Ricin B-type lectin domain-containing protein n=1 Tax=Heterorhabditis bacteriophora TaxID=37862 RepID=A0A1I7WZH9_HETBA